MGFFGNIGHIGQEIAGRAVVLSLATIIVGCQVAPAISTRRLVQHRSMIDLSGLRPAQVLEGLKVSWATPSQWEALPLKITPLYSHQQWRSPTLSTGVGVAHIRLPIPLPAEAIVWFAKAEYLKKARDQKDGRLIGQWSDSLGRQWFEAENNRYHVRGYAMTRGADAWIVYSGWRMGQDPHPLEIALAGRSVESIVPVQ